MIKHSLSFLSLARLLLSLLIRASRRAATTSLLSTYDRSQGLYWTDRTSFVVVKVPSP